MMTQSSQASTTTVTGEWECTECGYIEEGAETRRPAQCPECDAPGGALEFYAYEDDDWEEDEEELALLDAEDVDDDELEDEDDGF